jgi:hypothetical protein
MGLKLDGLCATCAIDTSSESIDIEGLDISSLQRGDGTINVEHIGPKTPGYSFSSIIGAVTSAKKLMCREDCENERQKKYWDSIELPCVYFTCELFDSEGHQGAQAAAALIKYYHSRNMPILARWSIDGHTIEREGNVLKRCIARDIALTVKPANHSCISGVIDEKSKKSGQLDELSRSEAGLIRIPGVETYMLAPDESPMALIRHEVTALQEMTKAMAAGGGLAAPGDLRQGAALAKEDVQGRLKTRLTTAFRDWPRRNTLKEHLVKALPDVHPDFLQKFVDLITESRLRKASELHEYLNKAVAGELNDKIAALGPAFEPSDADRGYMPKTKAFGKPKGKVSESITATSVVPPPEGVKQGSKKFSKMSPEERQVEIAKVNADAAKSNPLTAGAHQAMQPQIPLVTHVPGLRVGVAPEHAQAKDQQAKIDSINALIAANNPGAAQIQSVGKPKKEFQKSEPTDLTGMPPKQPEILKVRGEAVHPGEIRYRDDLKHQHAGKSFKLLYSTPTHHVVLKGTGPTSETSRIPIADEGKSYEVINRPAAAVVPNILAKHHLHEASNSPEQLALASRLDFSHKKKYISDEFATHAVRGQPPWVQGSPKVFVKPSASYIGSEYATPPDPAIAESAFHNVARDAFGMGGIVPTTISFWHPHDGRLHSAQDFVRDGSHDINDEHLGQWNQQGVSPRMAIMDHVLGNKDRHGLNFMRAADGSPRLIDNGFAFQYGTQFPLPEYVRHQDKAIPFSPDVGQWIQSINPQTLHDSLKKSGIPLELRQHAIERLSRLREKVAIGQHINYNTLIGAK